MSANPQRSSAIPILDWLLSYQREWLSSDLIAGLIAAAVVIPKAMAYATIAGLPVQVGLYTAFLPMVIYAVLGTSRPLSVSTTTTLAILAAAQLGQVVPDGDPASLMRAAATLTFLVGAILVLASLLRLGFVANFISEPVLIGFKAGIAIVIVVDQVPKLLGVHFPKGAFVHNLLAIVQAIPHTSIPTLIVGIVMIVLLVGIEHFLPRAPAPLIVVAGGIAGASLLGLQAHGVEVVGQIPQGLPSLISPGLLTRRKALARGRGHRADELHRDGCGRARLRNERRAASAAEPGATGDRTRECVRRATGGHAVGRRHHTDSGQPSCGRAHAVGGACHSGGRAADDASSRPSHRADAASHPCGRGHRLLDRTDQAGRFPRNPPDPTNGVHLGPDRSLQASCCWGP